MSSISKDLLFSTSTTVNVTKNFDTLLFPTDCIRETDLTRLDFKGFNGLQSVTIGDNNFQSVDEVQAIGIESLVSMTVGKSCFTKYLYNRLLTDYFNKTGSFTIANCPKFRSLSIGPQSFSHYTTFNASSTIRLYS